MDEDPTAQMSHVRDDGKSVFRYPSLYSRLFTIHVGVQNMAFPVHEEILKRHSARVAAQLAQSKHYSQAKEYLRELLEDFKSLPQTIHCPPKQAHM